MKKIILIFGLLIAVSNLTESKHRFDLSVNIGVFYNPLARYGEWIESDWGYAWRPMHMRHSWRPYIEGRWIWTDYGWYWVSHEPFGWATYHYGRWNYDDYYGWIWVPDNEWGPAWVDWRYDDDYIGWAPLPPIATFSISVGITFSRHWVTPMHYWNFIPFRHFTSERVTEYIQPIDRVRRIYNGTHEGYRIRGEDNRIINRGIDLSTIEQRTNSRVRRTEIVDRDNARGERLVRNGNTERIEAYRPRVSEQRDDNRLSKKQLDRLSPREYQRESEGKRAAERKEERYQIQKRDIERPERGIEKNRSSAPRDSRIQGFERREVPDRQVRESQREQNRPPHYERPSEKRMQEAPRIDRQPPQIREPRQPQMRERPQSEPRRDNSRPTDRNRRRP
ncbi:MAG: hypothetical protein HZB59_04135 [Ignavibacteriales bacterium]|nr:hypothetical protein [Ignavibacteriales bacterium]